MGKATEFDDVMERHLLTQEEKAARYPKVPELRLRTDAPAVEVDATTRARDVMSRAQGEGITLLRDADGGVPAVVMPVERYLELVGTELVNDPFNKESGPGGITPTADALAALHVEQTNPSEPWNQGSL